MEIDSIDKFMNGIIHSINQGKPVNEGQSKLETLYGCGDHLSAIYIYKGFFPENSPILTRILSDACKAYSYIRNETSNCPYNKIKTGLINECLIRMNRSKSSKSLQHLCSIQFFNFINRKCNRFLLDIGYLLSYVNELRVAFNTLSAEDRQNLKPNLRNIRTDAFIQATCEDSSFLINWATVEVIKYCIYREVEHVKLDGKHLLDCIFAEVWFPFKVGDRMRKRCLVNFIQNLDRLNNFKRNTKFISDTKAESYLSDSDFTQFRKYSKLLESTRVAIMRLSIIIDDPAECWRAADTKLSDYDLFKLRERLCDQKDKELTSFTLGAKHVNDIPLIYGLCKIFPYEDLLIDIPLGGILYNLNKNYEAAYDDFLAFRESGQGLIEFLNCCVELNLVEENKEHIKNLESPILRSLYSKYNESKSNIPVPAKRLDEVRVWLDTWSDFGLKLKESASLELEQPVSTYMNLLIPTCLNTIARMTESTIRQESVKMVENLISQEFVVDSMFQPNFFNQNLKIFHTLADLLGSGKNIDLELVRIHAKDLYWNHSIYRNLCDMKMIELLRKKDPSTVDLIQFRAAKFNRSHRNFKLASKIAKDLIIQTKSCYLRHKSTMLLLDERAESNDKLRFYVDMIETIRNSNLTDMERNNMMLKTIRFGLQMFVSKEVKENSYSLKIREQLEKLILDRNDEKDELNFQNIISSANLNSKCKALSILVKSFGMRYKINPNCDALMNRIFYLNLELLESLSHSNKLEFKSLAVECGGYILESILRNHKRLSKDNRKRFESTNFLTATRGSWSLLRTSLISTITCNEELEKEWRDALIELIKVIAQTYPNLLIYSIVTNRLESHHEPVCANEDSKGDLLLMQNSLEEDGKKHKSDSILKNHALRSNFWNNLFELIKNSKTNLENNWGDILLETEQFVKEIKKISYLSHEYFRTLSIMINRKLNNFYKYFSNNCDSISGLIVHKHELVDCQNRLNNICDIAINSIDILLSYGKNLKANNTTKYDSWFFETFHEQLIELKQRISLLSRRKQLIKEDIEKAISSITSLLSSCNHTLTEYYQSNRRKLFMEVINPILSRLEPSKIPMPNCCEQISSPSKPIVTIYKISQTVRMIVSKTNPKKLEMTGSDGKTRSFLLKAHDDLRLDQLIMDLLRIINISLSVNKKTSNLGQIRRYSVTPLSERSGLIEWIDADSIGSSYKEYLNTFDGKRTIESIYKLTCKDLCDDNDGNHENCSVPQNSFYSHVFYQLLWATTKHDNGLEPLTKVRPNAGNIISYRSKFEPSVFEGVVTTLMNKIPNNLLKNKIWYNTSNSYSYWSKTKQFTNSCAIMSIVGYIIGLGDRHVENILIDYSTGEIVHIDYSISLELAKSLPIPESVPFRLTQNMVKAFGFAGLEGNFTMACRDVLGVMRDHKSFLLHFLSPLNLSFMISSQTGSSKPENACKRNLMGETGDLSARQSEKKSSKTMNLSMCSQESVEMNLDVDKFKLVDCYEALMESHDEPICATVDFQGNIKTPTRISTHHAGNIYERIRDKLTGYDNQLNHLDDLTRPQSLGDKFSLCESLPIFLNKSKPIGPKSVEKQVEDLISEATSTKNLGNIYEGWGPWI